MRENPRKIEMEFAFLPDASMEAEYLNSVTRLDLTVLRINLSQSRFTERSSHVAFPAS